jgi:putative transposase
MVRNRHLAGKILDASWSRFFAMLSYKAENAWKIIVKVNPMGTSREYMHGELDRDYNVALNILERSLGGLGRPSEPFETKPLLPVAASIIVEAGSPHPFRVGSSRMIRSLSPRTSPVICKCKISP